MNSFEAAGQAQLLAVEGQRQIAAAIGAVLKTVLLRIVRMATRHAPAGNLR